MRTAKDFAFAAFAPLVCLVTIHAAVTLYGCGAVRVEAEDARDVVSSALECVETIGPNANVAHALSECSDTSRQALAALCAAKVVLEPLICGAL